MNGEGRGQATKIIESIDFFGPLESTECSMSDGVGQHQKGATHLRFGTTLDFNTVAILPIAVVTIHSLHYTIHTDAEADWLSI